ncbi:SusC/RagA family TonB-linked outer membrane protein [Chitinophaga ginsengisegetis]|uniref:SusC/RagA family TonB-linked outer membrane protein n=1 Tax=Chitinophaga ginsengisegetis TaxID=393003 RepID=UPI000DB983FC|nr:SusC/RagA family TonB-linked outer membrane protein [Chitinophaga ginsengisegetis]MDR6569532.1 TonB-linked SusC/RagA family outer membrane protein [Chitinophaga ginsengisegetis]MDR6649265.1 TonB-linked SusC/RagA family outer membrane protein [Chitinophaga ginsengisegetis]MDR6655615.1 TonB-linked SusC/RagA family outer membrane protein [Chitinophaga ginsengisegetis]
MLLPKSSLLVLLCLCSTLALFAQQNITGKIRDAVSGKPIPGVTVRIPNTNKGTITDADGNYTLAITAGTTSLMVSYTGYKTKTINLTPGNNVINLTLEEDFARLDEIVVTGLATNVKRSNLANAVATISGTELNGVAPAQTFDAALSGKVPGAMITANSGAPGGGISVKMRGITSVFGNSQPLYVVDGIFFNNSSIPAGLNDVTGAATSGSPNNQDNPSSRIADLNPEDIENIEILKGASAAAMYGAKAAAGVIIITTKKGKSGKTKISLNQETGFTKVRHLMGVRTFTPETAADLAGTADNPDPDVQAKRAAYKAQFTEAKNAGKIFDYEKEIFGQTGLVLNTGISLSGGGEKTTFYLSGNRRQENGIVKGTGYFNNSIRLNVDHKVSDRVSVGVTTNYINSSADRGLTNNDNNGVSLGVALSSTPDFVNLFPNALGEYPRNTFASSNPLETRDNMINNEQTNRFVGGGNIEIRLQQSDRSTTRLVGRGGIDYFNFKTAALFPRNLQFEENGLQGHSIQGNTNNTNTNIGGFIVNTFTPNNNLSLTSTAGATLETGYLDNIVTVATNLVSGQSNLDASANTTTRQFRQKYRDNGIFIQEDLSLIDAITFSAGVRFDRSTNNGEYQKYYVFPKGSISWNIAKMDFWQVPGVDNLKLRAAYGQSGNVPPYGSKFTQMLGSNIGGFPGVLVENLQGNPDIKPERQTEFETGLDVSVLNGRISLEATYYNKKIYDVLLRHALPGSSGYATEWKNSGDLRNKGIELGLNLIPVNRPNVRWNSSINWWQNRSKVTKLIIPPYAIGAFGNSLGTFYLEEGQPATQIKGTVNGELKLIGNAEPDFQMSFFNELTVFKNLSLRFLIHWKKGGDNINLTQLLTDLGATSFDYDDEMKGTKAGLYRPGAGDASIYVQDASYVRIREIGLYYNIPIKNTAILKAIRVGVSANNFFTWTKYVGYDPEVSNFGSNTITTAQTRGSNGLSTGVDVMPFPASKRASFHVGVDF